MSPLNGDDPAELTSTAAKNLFKQVVPANFDFGVHVRTEGKRMTLAELAAFIATCADHDIPPNAIPSVKTDFSGHLKDIHIESRKGEWPK